MAVAVELPYSVDTFNSLLGLNESNEQFLTRNGRDVLLSSIWDLFYKYKSNLKYGPVLLHRHWPVKSDQAVVDVNGTSTPWSLKPADESGVLHFKKYGKQIRPCSWRIVNGHLMPYEFYLDHDNDQDEQTTIDANFVKEFASILEANGLTNLVGLRLVRDPEQKVLEVTEGYANVTFTLTREDYALLGKQSIEAGWMFPATDPSKGNLAERNIIASARCTVICRSIDKGHIRVHLGGSEITTQVVHTN